MKNKALTYFLIVIVALVWGVIIYRVFDATTSDDDIPVTNNSVPIKKESLENYISEKDTSHLSLNYPDPFVDEAKEKPKVIPVSKLITTGQVVKPITKSGVNWSFISYSGYIKNSKSKKLLAFVTINGKEYSMIEGETADKVKLIKNMIDSIKIAYNGNQKFILMNIR